tara:strand:+ start:539 stop:793 length:255 start_codon:yes stop_codon:yes gene_type:complete
MNISDKEELSKQIFKNTKLENEVNDLKEKLMAEKIRNKSELEMNNDLKRIIETSKLQIDSLNKILDQYAQKIVFYRNQINKFLD